jgi:hypothetical protein
MRRCIRLAIHVLSSLTPRLIRSKVENELGLPTGTLDAPTYKVLVKRIIHDAMVCIVHSFHPEEVDETDVIYRPYLAL